MGIRSSRSGINRGAAAADYKEGDNCCVGERMSGGNECGVDVRAGGRLASESETGAGQRGRGVRDLGRGVRRDGLVIGRLVGGCTACAGRDCWIARGHAVGGRGFAGWLTSGSPSGQEVAAGRSEAGKWEGGRGCLDDNARQVRASELALGRSAAPLGFAVQGTTNKPRRTITTGGGGRKAHKRRGGWEERTTERVRNARAGDRGKSSHLAGERPSP